MTDVLLPPWFRIAAASAELADNSAVSPPTYSGDWITTGFGGDRMKASLEFAPVGGRTLQAERGALEAFLFSLQGRQNRLYMTPKENRARGSFPTGELLPNTIFDSSSPWASSNTAQVTISPTSRRLRLKRVAAGSDATIQSGTISVTGGAYYVARAFMYAGKGSVRFRIRLGSTAGGSEIAASAADIALQGMATLVGQAAGSTMHFSILDGFASRAAGDYQDLAYVSLARCAVVNGAGQSGQALSVTGLPSSIDDLILPGQRFEVITSRGSEFKVCKAPVHSDGAGDGYLRFSPPLRGTVADVAAVILHQPFGYFLAPGGVPASMTEPGLITRASIDLVESA